MTTNKHKVTLDRTFDPAKPDLAKLLHHFFANNDHYAIAKTVAGEVTYTPVKQALTVEMLQEHLAGKVTLGAYHLDKESMVRWLGWDVDSADLTTARKYAEKIIARIREIPHAVEFSGSKGYHILIFLEHAIPAIQAKQIVDFVRDAEALPRTGKSHVEAYPKQAKLDKALPMGSLLKIPLGEHPKTHNRSIFVDPSNGWETGNPLPPEQILMNVVNPDVLVQLMRGTVDIHKQIVDVMIPQWAAAAGEHHNLALYLSGYLAHLGWGLEDAMNLVHEVALKAGDLEVNNRVQAVRDTFRNISEGRTVKGYSGLNDMLPGGVLRTLSELATQIIAPTLVKRIDAIRLQKSPPFEKVRGAASVVWADLQEHGEVVQTAINIAYFFDSEMHLLLPLASARWQANLHKSYGINPVDGFGSQVTEELRLRAISDARVVTVQNRTVWTGEELFVNLGGPEVYKLTGEDIITTSNGTCGFLFQTDLIGGSPIIPDFSRPINVWDKLVKDISFTKSQDAPATPEEQAELLKAWLLAFFFSELLPTKPLLLALGAPGSGKTTAMRRILKMLESTDSDVLEVVADKPDSLRASVALHRFMVLDNLEKSGAKWLVDTLNRLATGANIEIRQLYKTNEVYTIKPNCFIAMTAVSMPFSEETLFSRILPLELQQLSSPLPEHLLQQQLQDNLPGMWADLLLKLNRVVATIKHDRSSLPPIASRLADFTVFCKRIEKSGVVNGAVLIKGLRSLVDRQKLALLESSPFVAILEEWLTVAAEDATKPHSFVELFSILEPLARTRKMSWRWNNAAALGRHIMAMAEPLKKLYRAQFIDEHDPLFNRDVSKVSFPGS